MNEVLQIKLGYVNTAFGQVHYREAGGGPTVVLLHESPLSGVVFEKALSFLGKHVRAIAPDTPGYGASTAPSRPLSIEGYASRMSKLLDLLGLNEIALVGNHTGASIAIELAANEPERIKALIVLGPPIFNEEERNEWLIKKKHVEPFQLSSDGSHLSRIWKRYQNRWGADTPPDLLHLATTEFLRSAIRYEWAYRAAFLYNAAKVLPNIVCPTLFLTTEGDALRSNHEKAIELTPTAEGRLLSFPHGQFPLREPRWFSEEIVIFLRRLGFIQQENNATGGSYV